MISRRKEEYQNQIALKLNDPITTTKIYCSILNTFYNGTKVPIILPLLINNNFISDFKAKTNHFNNFFAYQCTRLDNSSKILESQTYLTNTTLFLIKFDN